MVLVFLDLNKAILKKQTKRTNHEAKEESGGLCGFPPENSERPRKNTDSRAAKREGFFLLSTLRMNIKRKTRSWGEARQERMRCSHGQEAWVILALEKR